MEHEDVEDARLLHNDDSTLSKLTDVSHVSQEAQLAWFKAMSASKSSRRYVARRIEDNKFVGVFRLDRIDPWNRNVFVGADVVPNFRGKGYATEMFAYFFEYLFNQCGLHRLALVTMETNLPAINLYRKLGFVEEGRERQAIYREGCYVDLISMSLLEQEWRSR
jgi:RimJ/RimL family protein N-acetyltransferase